jgi:hypothetical protein
MSMVTVHGPHTMYTKSVVTNGPAKATVNPANGLAWTFEVSPPSARPAADFDWTYTPAGGAPTSPINDSKAPFTITFSGAGVKTVTLTVSGSTPGAGPANGVYVMGINAVSGVPPA